MVCEWVNKIVSMWLRTAIIGCNGALKWWLDIFGAADLKYRWPQPSAALKSCIK